MRPSGTLYVVATPIGNLEDLTFRALRTLRGVDVIAAEDTRRTSKLLAHYEIAKPLVSLHEHNEYRAAPSLVARLSSGDHIALVSDAGTPGISDPGAELVRLARASGLTVVPIPGPSAVTTALSVAGLAISTFTFLGFPPGSGANRQRWLEEVSLERRAVVFFEAPHRMRRTARDLTVYCGVRPIYMFRELTKINETMVVWTNSMSIDEIGEQGEFVCVFPPGANAVHVADTHGDLLGQSVDIVSRLTNNNDVELDEVVSAIHSAAALSPARLRNYLKKARLATKRQADGPLG